MPYQVIFTPESERDLDGIYDYIREQGFPGNALRFAESIVRFCQELAIFPKRGVERSGLLPGFRVVGFHRRVTVLFQVLEAEETIRIARVLYGGQSVERVLRDIK